MAQAGDEAMDTPLAVSFSPGPAVLLPWGEGDELPARCVLGFHDDA